MHKRTSIFVVATMTLMTAASAIGLSAPASAHGGHVVRIADVTVTEGSGGGTQDASVNISISPAPQPNETLAVDWATSDAPPATASSGTDFLFREGTATFDSSLLTSRTITIPIAKDSIDEPNETFVINLFNARSTKCGVGCTNPSAVSIGDSQSTVAITDDDTPSITINDVSVYERNEGKTPAALTVTRHGATTFAVNVSFASYDGSAKTADNDYERTTGTVTFAPSNASSADKTIQIPVVGDTRYESNEVFYVSLSGATNATISDAQGAATVRNDDGPPPNHADVNDVSVGEGNNATFAVRLSSPPGLGQSANVAWSTSNGSAVEPDDYTRSSGTIHFGPGETARTATVPTHQDTVDEPDQTFTVTLAKPAACCTSNFNYELGDKEGQGTVVDDDDATAELKIDDASVIEPDSGTTTAQFTVTRTGTTERTVTVDYATADDTALSPSDYTSQAGTLSFAPSDTTKTISIAVIGDLGHEPNEAFFINLSNAQHASITDAQALGTITNDDPENPTLAIGDASVTEGNSGSVGAVFTVTKTGPTKQAVTVDFTTADDTARVPGDYASQSGTLSFATDESTKTISVAVAGDSLDEPDEHFVVNLSNGVNATISDGQGVGTINNDDEPTPPREPKVGDFNGDGSADAVFGVPGDEVGTAVDAGALNVIYGSVSKLTSNNNRIWTLNTADVAGTAASGDLLGYSVASGDFNGDGFSDLAAGAPRKSNGAGAVVVLYGSASELTGSGSQLWTQDTGDVADTVESGDNFGASLSSGDFDGNGISDLAVGVPGENVGSVGDAGSVNVLYGTTSGLSATGNQLWHQNVVGVAGVAGSGDGFGAAVTTGDFDNDGRDDLVAGVPGETIGSQSGAGAVNVFYGSASGLSADRNRGWHQDSTDVPGVAGSSDHFGAALTSGDLDGNGTDDLAVGVPGENVGSADDAGAVNVLYGTSTGIAATGAQVWHQDVSGVAGLARWGDRLGSALASGDFDGDGSDDLAAGVPGDTIGSQSKAGAVNILYGSGSGLSSSRNSGWHQDSAGVPGVAASDDNFGVSLSVGDYNGDGSNDLVVGVPRERIGSNTDAGAGNVLYGSGGGLSGTGSQGWHQDSSGIEGATKVGDFFGRSVA